MDTLKTFDDLDFLFKKFLDIDPKTIDITSFDRSLPLELRTLYAIRSEYTKRFPDKILFDKQDQLVQYEDLELNDNTVTFIYENQGNWSLQTELNKETPVVYKDNEEIISNSLNELLVTYTLQELVFSLTDIDYGNFSLEQLKSKFPTVMPLWTNRHYIYNDDEYNYFLVQDEGIYMDANGTIFFASNNNEILKS